MKYLKDKKLVGIIIILIIIIFTSAITYGKNKSRVFKDEYMQEIFVEENYEKDTIKADDVKLGEELGNKNELIVVEIKGEVQSPDVYELEDGSIVKDLIDLAGGLTQEADITKINRAKKLQNHELLIIGNKNDIHLPQINVINSIDSSGNVLININTADLEELKNITGIGDVKAQSIIDYREKNGGFKSVEELKNIDGIGDKTFEKIKDEVTL